MIFGFSMGGLVLVLLLGDLHYASHWGVLVLCLIGAVLGCREFARLARVHAAEVQLAPILAISWALAIAANLAPDSAASGADILHRWADHVHRHLDDAALTSLLLGLGLAWTLIAQMARHATTRFFANVGATVLGMVYLGVIFGLIQRLALLAGGAEYYGDGAAFRGRGTELLLLFLAATKLGDVAAYFGGRALGRHKMAPAISPGKTWEGFACSFVGSIGGSYLFAWIFSLAYAHGPFNGWWQPLVWGLVLGPLGVAGDLAESCMKRDAAMKDSGTAIPGFGGFLDIFDALVVAAPVAYLLALVL